MTGARPLVALVATVAAVAGCGPSTPAEVGAELSTVVDGVLTACVAPTPRLVVESPDTHLGWDGYDVAVLRHVADTLALPLALEITSYDELVSGLALNARTCDVAAGGMVVTPALSTVLDVSAPYRDVDRLIVSRPGQIAAATVVEDLAAFRVGYEAGGPASDVAALLTSLDLAPYPSRTDLQRAFDDRDVDALLIAPGDIEAVAHSAPRADVILRIPNGQQTVLALPKGADDRLLEAIDAAIAAFVSDPGHAQLVADWLDG